jgi:hypothetical protein
MSRFISWLAVAVTAAFLVVVSLAFAPTATVWLAFAISIGTLAVSAGIAYRYRGDMPSLLLGLATSVVSAWTIVATLVFSQGTVQTLALASSLAITGLAVVGLTAHEIEHDYVVLPAQREDTSSGQEPRLATAA